MDESSEECISVADDKRGYRQAKMKSSIFPNEFAMRAGPKMGLLHRWHAKIEIYTTALFRRAN
jgi:hypothetical protein